MSTPREPKFIQVLDDKPRDGNNLRKNKVEELIKILVDKTGVDRDDWVVLLGELSIKPMTMVAIEFFRRLLVFHPTVIVAGKDKYFMKRRAKYDNPKAAIRNFMKYVCEVDEEMKDLVKPDTKLEKYASGLQREILSEEDEILKELDDNGDFERFEDEGA